MHDIRLGIQRFHPFGQDLGLGSAVADMAAVDVLAIEVRFLGGVRIRDDESADPRERQCRGDIGSQSAASYYPHPRAFDGHLAVLSELQNLSVVPSHDRVMRVRINLSWGFGPFSVAVPIFYLFHIGIFNYFFPDIPVLWTPSW